MKTVGFQQIALNAVAVSDGWTFNGYGLFPVGDVEQKLNSHYDAGALNTYGLDVGYFVTPSLQASVGYFYQHRDQEDVDGSGVRGRLAYDISPEITAGINISYDEAFDARVSTDVTVRFGGAPTAALRQEVQKLPAINALTTKPRNRNIRVHDDDSYPTYVDGNPVYPTENQCLMYGGGLECVPYAGGYTPVYP